MPQVPTHPLTFAQVIGDLKDGKPLVYHPLENSIENMEWVRFDEETGRFYRRTYWGTVGWIPKEPGICLDFLSIRALTYPAWQVLQDGQE